MSCNLTTSGNYPTDTIPTHDGNTLAITFFKHASLALCINNRHIYVDPVSGYADYAALPKADLILITHTHYDHLDPKAINLLSTLETEIVCDSTSADSLGKKVIRMRPGQTVSPRDYIAIEAVAAYNTTEGHLQFHPRERQDCGYILTIGNTRIYISGDTELTPEMRALRKIDIAFLPVNQPYTMTVDQAIEAVKAIRPALFYPYHYGEVEEKSDIDRLARALKEITEVRIRPME